MSTAPQFGRACTMHGDPEGMMAMGHAGAGKGRQAQVVSKYLGGCGAHRCYCCVQPDGRVNPCVYMPTRTLGDLRKSSFADIWNNPLEAVLSDRDDRGDHCGICDYRIFCGGCRARAEAYTGDVQAGDPGCIYNKHMWDEINSGCGTDAEATAINSSRGRYALSGQSGCKRKQGSASFWNLGGNSQEMEVRQWLNRISF
jgi:radical SAM protein with 4Fe4S-binding SPASM domain